MRFVLIFLMCCFGARFALAAPGDKYNEDTNWSDRRISKRQSLSSDRPAAPSGFSVKKIETNLGNVVALAVINDDLFVADAAQDRVLRLKSRNANHVFETRAEFLIGFTQIRDLAVSSNWLFMSDNTGVWKIDVGNSLVANEAPELFFSHPRSQEIGPASIDLDTNKNMLVLGLGNCVFTVELISGKAKKLACATGRIQDIAISPNGGIWASVVEKGATYIKQITESENPTSHLKLPPNAKAVHMQFWSSESYSKSWPQEWTSDLIFSMTGGQPMLARAHFNFGDISSEFTSFIDGFSNPSRFVGSREYWGSPGAMAILGNGQLVFTERERGSLWTLQKDKLSTKKKAPMLAKKKPARDDIELKRKTKPVVLPRGSSIDSASTLESDALLRPSIRTGQDINED